MEEKPFNTSLDVKNFHNKLGYSDKFCIAPFSSLFLEPDGKVGVCRHKGSEFPVGNLLNNSFEEIWNGNFIKNWRQEFLDGKVSTCSKEVKYIKCNHCPDYNSLAQIADLSLLQTKKPLRLAFNFNGHCNLECKMCHIWQKPNGLYDKINFWEQLDSWIENLEEVELLSGEPFIQKDTYKLIDLISPKKPNARWIITTNANWKLTTAITDKLDKIKIRNLIISLDSLNENTYQKIRKKGDLKKALATLNDLNVYSKSRIERGLGGLNIKINFLFQQDNWMELGDVYNFSIKTQNEIFRTFLYEPEQYSILAFPENKRIEILEWYFSNLNVEQLKNSMRVIRPLLDSLQPIDKFYFYQKYQFSLNEKNELRT